MKQTTTILRNDCAMLETDLYGGAITCFQLHSNNINPLTFRFRKEQMPVNNQAGAPYQGHFLCLGRWGEPSAGEIKARLPDHGEAANILWKANEQRSRTELKMHANCRMEGLRVERTIQLDRSAPVYACSETVTNTAPLGRLYNMVQHPTLATPFLHNDTTISCNAERGFNYACYEQPEKNASSWPAGIIGHRSIDLRSSQKGANSVFSFIVDKKNKWGWITAYSPQHRLLFGYMWKRVDYAWINLWQDWTGDTIRYRGLEFGTTGIHQPFGQILQLNVASVFGESTFDYLDAGESRSRSYLSFLCQAEAAFSSVDDISISDNTITIKSGKTHADIEGLTIDAFSLETQHNEPGSH